MKHRITPPPMDTRCTLYCTERICMSAVFRVFYTNSVSKFSKHS